MFRLNKLTDYGIVLMAHVARSPEETPHTARSLAKETRLPLPTVGKLLRQLSEHRLLSSHRGVNGGYNLAREARSISVAEIILALEGPIGFTECSVVKGLCILELMRHHEQLADHRRRSARCAGARYALRSEPPDGAP